MSKQPPFTVSQPRVSEPQQDTLPSGLGQTVLQPMPPGSQPQLLLQHVVPPMPFGHACAQPPNWQSGPQALGQQIPAFSLQFPKQLWPVPQQLIDPKPLVPQQGRPDGQQMNGVVGPQVNGPPVTKFGFEHFLQTCLHWACAAP